MPAIRMQVLVLGCALVTSTAIARPKGEPSTATLHKKARQRMATLDFDAALPLLQQALKNPNVPAPERAELLVDVGITDVNLGDNAGASQAFTQAVDADPTVHLPAGISPKIRLLFEQAQDARKPSPPPPPPEPQPVASAPIPPPPPPAPAPVTPTAAAMETHAAGPSWVGPGVCFGVAVAGIAAGVTTASISNGAFSALSASPHSTADADALLSKQRTFATVSAVSYAAGGAAAVGGLAWLLFAPRDKGLALSGAPMSGGALVSVQGRF